MVIVHPDTTAWVQSTGQRGYERETFEGPTGLLPELEIFGWLRFHSALVGALKPDRHAGAYEIHYMVRGHLLWQVAGEQRAFGTGQVLVVRPDELHSGNEGSLQPCEHYWLRLSLPNQQVLPGLTAAETEALREGYEHLYYRTFVASREVGEFFDRLLEIHRQPRTLLTLPLARGLLHALLITLLRDHERHSQISRQKPLVSWRVRRTLEWIEGRIGKADLRLDDLAANLGVSMAGLRLRFKAETGYTLHEYVVERRLEAARRRLTETNDDVTTIAHELGFSSSQYFATVFTRRIGISPGAYRKRHQAASKITP